MSVNRVTISGNIGRDPELRSTASGTAVLSFSVCVNDRQKVNGEWKDKPNWVDCIIFGNRAESVSRYLSKGSHVTVDGRLSQNTWETKEGQRRSKLEVIVDNIDFSGSKRADAQAEPQAEPETPYDDDIPF